MLWGGPNFRIPEGAIRRWATRRDREFPKLENSCLVKRVEKSAAHLQRLQRPDLCVAKSYISGLGPGHSENPYLPGPRGSIIHRFKPLPIDIDINRLLIGNHC